MQKKIDESSEGWVGIKDESTKFGKKGEPVSHKNLFCPFRLLHFVLTLYSYALMLYLLYYNLQILVLGFPQNCSANKMCQEQAVSSIYSI